MSKRFTDTIDTYFKDIENVSSPLTKEEEKKLAIRIQGGDERAINELVMHNLKFVVLLANRFSHLGEALDDLIQEGNTGLIEAARRFTPDKNVKFITYAQFWIRKRLNEFIARHGRTVRIPHNQEYDDYKKRIRGESVPDRSNIEIDRPLEEGDSMTMGDLILSEEFSDPFESETDDSHLSIFLNQLNEEELKIIKLFYGIEEIKPRSTREIGTELNLEESRVNRILKIARAKMRKVIK
jgi:RNA polymerase primary sigma factor